MIGSFFRFEFFAAFNFACLVGLFIAAPKPLHAFEPASEKKIPVILDTDIGDDIDDTWALVLLLKSPEFDIKMVVGDYGKTEYRTKLLAKFLEVAGRTDIPIGVGVGDATGTGGQEAWVKTYNLGKYPGVIHQDGVSAMIDLIDSADQKITLLAVGPLPNIKAALEKSPQIVHKVDFVGMQGSIHHENGQSSLPIAEYNVKQDVAACQEAFVANWNMTITPLDTCGQVQLAGERYLRLQKSKDPLIVALMENYRLWAAAQLKPTVVERAKTASSTLFDTVAVYLALDTQLCKMQTLPIQVTDDGLTIIKPGAKDVSVAVEWHDLEAFKDWLVSRLLNKE
jgi:inosine-uridine nucleoside N-ribohydrolase